VLLPVDFDDESHGLSPTVAWSCLAQVAQATILLNSRLVPRRFGGSIAMFTSSLMGVSESWRAGGQSSWSQSRFRSNTVTVFPDFAKLLPLPRQFQLPEGSKF
jgi:hypothetical protein